VIAAVMIIRENSSGCLGNVWIKSDFYALAVRWCTRWVSLTRIWNISPPMCFYLFIWSKLEIENHMDIQVFIKN